MATVPRSILDWYNQQVKPINDPNARYGQPGTSDNLGSSGTPVTPIVPKTTSTNTGVATPGPQLNPPATTPSITTGSTNTNTGLLPSVTLPNSAKVTPSTYNPTLLGDQTNWNITKDQTVQGQLNDVMSQDSPLMQLSRTEGLQSANKRGLLNSSMAVGAAQDAVIRNALPIAQADADVYSRAAGYNADTGNTFTKANADIKNNASQFGAEAKNRASEFNATNEYGQYQNEFEKQQALFDANVKASLQQIESAANWDLQSQDIFGGLSKGFSDAMTAINTDKNMNQKSKDYSIAQLFETYKAQISLLSAVGSVPDVSELLTFDVTA